jgi:GNAT superfamily N-acetyltransferase
MGMERAAESEAIVRLATVNDLPHLLRLYHELDETHRSRHPELFPTSIERDPARIESMLGDSQMRILVATLPADDSGLVVGFARAIDVRTPGNGILLARRFVLVDELAVMPEHRRAGVASALLSEVEVWARQLGIDALEVTVWAFNQAASELYAQRGFSTMRHYLRKSLA